MVVSSSHKLVLRDCAYVQVSLFPLQCCLSKGPAPVLGKWLDGFVLQQAPKLLFMNWLSIKCWDKLGDTRVSVLEIICLMDMVAAWEPCTLIHPIYCCLFYYLIKFVVITIRSYCFWSGLSTMKCVKSFLTLNITEGSLQCVQGSDVVSPVTEMECNKLS